MKNNNPTKQPKYKILDYVYVIHNRTILRATVLGVDICDPTDKQEYIYKLKTVHKDKINNKWYFAGDEYFVLEDNISQSKEKIIEKFKSEQNRYLKALKKDFDDKIKKVEKYLKSSE